MNQGQGAKNIRRRLINCLLLAAGVCAAQMIGNRVLITGCLLLYLAASAYAAMCGYAMLLLFFFLPWSPVLKLAPGSFSFYTFAMLVICGIGLLRAKQRLPARCLAAAVGLLGITMLSKVLDGNLPQLNYGMFMFLLALFPLAVDELKTTVTFWELTVFFSVGVIAAALAAAVLVYDPQIARYIDVYSWNGIVRRSGFYGDANFYAAQITAALAGVLALAAQAKSSRSALLYALLTALLLYCGLLSASKSFAITAGAVCVVWSLSYPGAGMPRRRKLIPLAVLSAGLMFDVCAGLLNGLVDTMLLRFLRAGNLADLTTGRTELWRNYLSAITADPKLLLFGKGFTNVKLDGRGSHNTLLQLIYQFGLVGSWLLLLWQLALCRRFWGGEKLRCGNGSFSAILIGVFLPWMAIDILFFDEFFLMPAYAMAARRWMEGGS